MRIRVSGIKISQKFFSVTSLKDKSIKITQRLYRQEFPPLIGPRLPTATEHSRFTVENL